EDEVWVVVRRTIGGVQKRFIERFRPDQFRAQTDSNLSDLFFVDSGRKIMGVELTEMTGLDHLEGMTVQVVADGAVFPPRVVTGGKITLNNELDPESASIIVAGLGYESQLEPMAMEVGLQNGTSVGRKKRIHEVYLVLLQSSGGRYGPRTTGEQWDPITTAEDLEQPVPLFSGGKNLSLEHRSDYDASFVISQTAPLPMTILAVVPKFNIYGDDD
ncbi:MAG: hypothetical protein JWO82_2161, partial [Akkermansiaceae bacterium]|nr:hypothetical protein [Akkermansiaceae bacterium]